MTDIPLHQKERQLQAERAKLLVVIALIAVFAALDTVHNYVAHQGGGKPISVSFALYGGMWFWLPYLPLVPTAIFLLNRYPLDPERRASFVIHGFAGLVFAYLHLLLVAIAPLPAEPTWSYGQRFFDQIQYDFALDYAVYCCIAAASLILERYSAVQEREVRASQLETRLAQTHLRAIQAQLSPHFFFNTLQCIAVLAMAGERDRVVEMLNRLSSLLRVSLDEHRPQQIPLAQELDFLESYLSIQQLSFGQRLALSYEIEPETRDAYVPTMLLQPLVENSILHGIAIKPGAGTLRISSQRRDAALVLQVADNGPGFRAPQGPPRRGIGLGATESRLHLLYGAAQSIEYGRSAEGGAQVRVTIPFHNPNTLSR